MSDLLLQQYVFDLNGYVVIHDALSPEEVGELNRLIDARKLPPIGESPRFGSAPTLGSSLVAPEEDFPESAALERRRAPVGAGFLNWGQAFCDLLDHRAIMPVLRLRLGDAFRLDRLYGMRMRQGMSYGPLHADYGASAPQAGIAPGEYYAFRSNQIHEGFIVVAWSLSDAGGEHGGFCCIPGSHKSNYRLPPQIGDSHEESPYVVVPPMPAGSVILFTESLTHGTARWNAAHERRTLLYKYCISNLTWTSKRVEAPQDYALTPRQSILLREPGDPLRHFPSLFTEVAAIK